MIIHAEHTGNPSAVQTTFESIAGLVFGAGQHNLIALGRDCSEGGHDQTTEGFIGAIRGGVSHSVEDLIDAHQPGHLPELPGLTNLGVLALIVVFIPDGTDDFLNDILNGDDSARAAVLVGDEYQLRSGGSHVVEHRVSSQRIGNRGDGTGQSLHCRLR